MADQGPTTHDADRFTRHLLACTVTIFLCVGLCLLTGLGIVIYTRFSSGNQPGGTLAALVFMTLGLAVGVCCTLMILLPVVLATEVFFANAPLAPCALVAVCLLAGLLLLCGILYGLVIGGSEGWNMTVRVTLYGTLVMIPPLAFYGLILRFSPRLLAILHRTRKPAEED